MKISRRAGAVSQILQIFVRDSSSTTGAGLTGLTSGSSGLTACYHRDTDTGSSTLTLQTMTVGTFTSSGFKEIDSTGMPGWYQLCPPNAALASGASSCGIHLKGATNMAPLPIEIDLDSQVDVYFWRGTAVSSPATPGVPDINVLDIGGTSVSIDGNNLLKVDVEDWKGGVIPAVNVTGVPKVDVVDWLGTAVTAATSGIPDVNVKNINNVAATSVTTINANVGTTQPVNFTGTAGSALVKSDMVDVAGAAVSTSSAQLGVNTVNIAGQAAALDANNLLKVDAEDWKGGVIPAVNVTGVPKVDVVDWLGTAPLALSSQQVQAVVPSSTVVASVTGAVGSVTGAVGSVTARVTANTDELAGQTVTAAAGVTFPASLASPTNITAGTITTATNLTNAPTSGDFTATMKTSLNAATPTASLSTLDTLVVQSGTAQAGAASTITLASGASATDNIYRGQEINVYGGTGAAQTRIITAYVGSTKVATVDEAWITNPDNTSTYKVLEIRAPKLDSSQQVTAASVQGNVTGSVASVTGAVGSVTARVTANTDQFAGQTITAASGVTLPASVASPTNITAGTITTATNLTNAPTAGDFTATMKTSLNAATPAVTVSDKTGFSLSSAGVQAIWDALTSALTTVGSIGKLLAALPGSIWDVVLSGHTTSGTTGAALNSASSAGDPWATALPGSYSSGEAGYIVGNTLDAAVSSRLPTASISLSAGAVTVGTNNDKTGYALTSAYDAAKTAAQDGDAMTLTSGERTTLAGVIWANATRTLTSFGTLVADTAAAVWAASVRTLSAFSFTVTTDVSSTVTANLDTTVSSRLATSGYTVPPTAAANADKLLGRNLAGGSDGVRTVQDALRPARNKVTVAGGVVTVYEEDDTTVAWTGTLTTDPAAEPITSVDPA